MEEVEKKAQDEVVDTAVEDTPTGRDAFYGKIREAYPDDELDDDAVYDKAVEHLGGLSEYKMNRSEIDNKLKDLFEQDPRMGAVFAELLEGKKPFRAILAEHYEPEDLVPQDGDDDYEAYEKTKVERRKSLDEQKSKQEKFQENIKNAEIAMQKFADDKGLDESGMMEFGGKIEAVLEDMADGVLTPDTLSLFYKGLNYDQDTKDIAEVSEVKGRNAKIAGKRSEKPKGDGLPDTSKGSTKVEDASRPRSHDIIDRMVGTKRDIFSGK